MISTEAGREIDFKPLPENADFSSRDNFESAQNKIDVSEVHPEKHDSQIISTEAGREIDFKSL
jgi:hypothetical protein